MAHKTSSLCGDSQCQANLPNCSVPEPMMHLKCCKCLKPFSQLEFGLFLQHWKTVHHEDLICRVCNRQIHSILDMRSHNMCSGNSFSSTQFRNKNTESAEPKTRTERLQVEPDIQTILGGVSDRQQRPENQSDLAVVSDIQSLQTGFENWTLDYQERIVRAASVVQQGLAVSSFVSQLHAVDVRDLTRYLDCVTEANVASRSSLPQVVSRPSLPHLVTQNFSIPPTSSYNLFPSGFSPRSFPQNSSMVRPITTIVRLAPASNPSGMSAYRAQGGSIGQLAVNGRNNPESFNPRIQRVILAKPASPASAQETPPGHPVPTKYFRLTPIPVTIPLENTNTTALTGATSSGDVTYTKRPRILKTATISDAGAMPESPVAFLKRVSRTGATSTTGTTPRRGVETEFFASFVPSGPRCLEDTDLGSILESWKDRGLGSCIKFLPAPSKYTPMEITILDDDLDEKVAPVELPVSEENLKPPTVPEVNGSTFCSLPNPGGSGRSSGKELEAATIDGWKGGRCVPCSVMKPAHIDPEMHDPASERPRKESHSSNKSADSEERTGSDRMRSVFPWQPGRLVEIENLLENQAGKSVSKETPSSSKTSSEMVKIVDIRSRSTSGGQSSHPCSQSDIGVVVSGSNRGDNSPKNEQALVGNVTGRQHSASLNENSQTVNNLPSSSANCPKKRNSKSRKITPSNREDQGTSLAEPGHTTAIRKDDSSLGNRDSETSPAGQKDGISKSPRTDIASPRRPEPEKKPAVPKAVARLIKISAQDSPCMNLRSRLDSQSTDTNAASLKVSAETGASKDSTRKGNRIIPEESRDNLSPDLVAEPSTSKVIGSMAHKADETLEKRDSELRQDNETSPGAQKGGLPTTSGTDKASGRLSLDKNQPLLKEATAFAKKLSTAKVIHSKANEARAPLPSSVGKGELQTEILVKELNALLQGTRAGQNSTPVVKSAHRKTEAIEKGKQAGSSKQESRKESGKGENSNKVCAVNLQLVGDSGIIDWSSRVTGIMGNKKYRCVPCSIIFANGTAFNWHFMKKHEVNAKFANLMQSSESEPMPSPAGLIRPSPPKPLGTSFIAAQPDQAESPLSTPDLAKCVGTTVTQRKEDAAMKKSGTKPAADPAARDTDTSVAPGPLRGLAEPKNTNIVSAEKRPITAVQEIGTGSSLEVVAHRSKAKLVSAEARASAPQLNTAKSRTESAADLAARNAETAAEKANRPGPLRGLAQSKNTNIFSFEESAEVKSSAPQHSTTKSVTQPAASPAARDTETSVGKASQPGPLRGLARPKSANLASAVKVPINAAQGIPTNPSSKIIECRSNLARLIRLPHNNHQVKSPVLQRVRTASEHSTALSSIGHGHSRSCPQHSDSAGVVTLDPLSLANQSEIIVLNDDDESPLGASADHRLAPRRVASQSRKPSSLNSGRSNQRPVLNTLTNQRKSNPAPQSQAQAQKAQSLLLKTIIDSLKDQPVRLNESEVICTACNIRFSYLFQLGDHLWDQHKSGRHQCPFCPFKFHLKFMVYGHMLAKHNKIRCELCTKGQEYSGWEFVCHVKSKHKNYTMALDWLCPESLIHTYDGKKGVDASAQGETAEPSKTSVEAPGGISGQTSPGNTRSPDSSKVASLQGTPAELTGEASAPSDMPGRTRTDVLLRECESSSLLQSSAERLVEPVESEGCVNVPERLSLLSAKSGCSPAVSADKQHVPSTDAFLVESLSVSCADKQNPRISAPITGNGPPAKRRKIGPKSKMGQDYPYHSDQNVAVDPKLSCLVRIEIDRRLVDSFLRDQHKRWKLQNRQKLQMCTKCNKTMFCSLTFFEQHVESHDVSTDRQTDRETGSSASDSGKDHERKRGGAGKTAEQDSHTGDEKEENISVTKNVRKRGEVDEAYTPPCEKRLKAESGETHRESGVAGKVEHSLRKRDNRRYTEPEGMSDNESAPASDIKGASEACTAEGVKTGLSFCPFCGKTSGSEMELQTHLASHVNKKYSCRDCSYESRDKKEFKRHIKEHNKVVPSSSSSASQVGAERNVMG